MEDSGINMFYLFIYLKLSWILKIIGRILNCFLKKLFLYNNTLIHTLQEARFMPWKLDKIH